MIFSENRFPLFRIMHFRSSTACDDTCAGLTAAHCRGDDVYLSGDRSGIFGRGAAAAAERPLTDAKIKKIDDLIAQQGRDVAISPVITDIVGLTQKDQTISCHAFGAVDAGSNDVRHIYLLPDGKGYLLDYFHQQIVGVYWADRSMVLIAALSGVRGQKPEPASFVQAQYGFRNELAGGQFADAHQ